MGRNRKTESQRRAERFGELYRIGKARIGLTEVEISQAIGISPPSLLKRRKEPDRFTLGEMVTLGRLFGWSREEFSSIYRDEKTG